MINIFFKIFVENLKLGIHTFSFKYYRRRYNSVANPDPGSGAYLTPGSGIRNRFFLDPGSQIHICESLLTIFLGKKFYNSLKIGPNYFLRHFKNKIIFNFVIFLATKMVWQKNFFHPSLLLLFLDPGSEIQDPGSGMDKDQDPGSGINIPDPQHWGLVRP